MLEYKYDTQLLVEGTALSSDDISAYITAHIAGVQKSKFRQGRHGEFYLVYLMVYLPSL